MSKNRVDIYPPTHVYAVTVEVLVDAIDEDDAEAEAHDLLMVLPAKYEITDVQQRSAE